MIVYLGLAGMLLLLDRVYLRAKENQKKYVWFFACWLMWFVLAFRHVNVSNDTIGYVRHFVRAQSISWGKIMSVYTKDPGFYVLLKLLGLISKEQIWFLCSSSFLSCIGVWIYIRKNTERPILALYFYVTITNFFFLMTGIRQAIAMSFCMLAVCCIHEKKILYYTILLFLAVNCHRSAWLFVPMYFLARRRVSQGNVFLNFAITVFVSLNYEFILGETNELLNYDYEVEAAGNGFIFFFIIVIIMLLSWVTYRQWMKKESDTVTLQLGIIATSMWFVRLSSRTIERVAMYWLNAIPIILVKSIESLKDERIYKIVLSGAIMGALLLYLQRGQGIPYQFCWG